MICHDYISYKISQTINTGNIIPIKTKDGSTSFYNTYFNESYHSLNGAKKESLEKFILPAEIDRFKNKDKVFILDLCFGLGYNTACLLENIKNQSTKLEIIGLEIDKRPLKLALGDDNFKRIWSSETNKIFQSISLKNNWEDLETKGKIIWGDARHSLKLIPESIQFDLIFHDAFSPMKCPQLWSEEFLQNLINKLSSKGRLITYSSSAAVRESLRRKGLNIFSIKPKDKDSHLWSIGTIGVKDKINCDSKNNIFSPLSGMEKEHLLTKASIPFRDPSGNSTMEDILTRRLKEQEKSSLASTTLWRKRWV